MPCRATWSSIWSKNPTPVASFDLPPPSRLSRTSICVSRVLRVTWAWRMVKQSEFGLILTQLRQCRRRRCDRRPSENFAQSADQDVALGIRADGNAHVGRDSGRMPKIPYDDASPAQLRRQLRAAAPGMTDEHEVRGRGNHFKIQFLETGNQTLAAFDDAAPGVFEIGLILHCRRASRLRKTIQRIGIEKILHPVQCLYQVGVTYCI